MIFSSCCGTTCVAFSRLRCSPDVRDLSLQYNGLMKADMSELDLDVDLLLELFLKLLSEPFLRELLDGDRVLK